MRCARAQLDINLTTVGLALTAVPGIEGMLRGQLVKLLAEKLVEPERTDVDAARLFAKKALPKQSGPGGMLVVLVRGAAGLHSGSHSLGGRVSAFAELRYGGAVRRTHVAFETGAPVWDALLAFPVPADSSQTLSARRPRPRPGCTLLCARMQRVRGTALYHCRWT